MALLEFIKDNPAVAIGLFLLVCAVAAYNATAICPMH